MEYPRSPLTRRGVVLLAALAFMVTFIVGGAIELLLTDFSLLHVMVLSLVPSAFLAVITYRNNR